jgi:ElaB/YqjD/DUF883 family membrane-anchored ribosome-binding protein
MDTDQTMDPSRTGSSTTEQVQQQAQQVAQQAKQSAQKATGKAQERMRSELNTRSAQAGGQIQSTADDLRSVGEELRKQGKDAPARFAEQAADRVEQVGRYLTESDSDKMLRDIEDFGRRQPWAVIAGGMALGFVASRFLKASSSRRYSTEYDWRTQAYNPRGVSGELPVYTSPGASASSSPSARAVEGYGDTYTESVYTEAVYTEPGSVDPGYAESLDDPTGATNPGGI